MPQPSAIATPSGPATITFAACTVLGSVRRDTGELTWFGPNGPEAVPSGPELVPIIGTAGHLDETLIASRRLDSSAQVELPLLNVDTTDTVSISVAFFVEDPLVLMACAEALPLDLVQWLTEEIADDLRRADGSTRGWFNVADGCDWLVIHLLRRRIRTIEASVRMALADETISGEDFIALRDYPQRLALIEQLWSQIPDPKITLHNKGAYHIPTPVITKTNPAEDARQATARLSGLISSQQVVLTQRQANETARFQRLITVVGAAVLVPGLIAAVFGANVGFRGRGTVHALSALLLLMLGSAVGSYSMLRANELGVWETLRRSSAIAWLTPESAGRRLSLMSAFAIICAAAGLRLLLSGHLF